MSSDHDMQLANEAAPVFIQAFYQALNDVRPLRTFYTTACSKYTDPPTICINGTSVDDVSKFEDIIKAQANGLSRRVVYTANSVDAHVLNSRFLENAPPWVVRQKETANGVSRNHVDTLCMLVLVSGVTRFGDANNSNTPAPRSFTERFTLVPNWDAVGSRSLPNARRWLIMSQRYRSFE